MDDRFGEVSPVAGAFFEALGCPTLLCILGNRMFFNMKEAGEHGVNVGTNWDSYTHSAMRFEESLHVDSDTEFVTSLIYAII